MTALAPKVYAQRRFQIPSLFGDHMVLQYGTASIWGKDRPGQKVVVTLKERTYTGQADSRGHWEVVLDGLAQGGPYEMRIQGSETVVLNDVLVGEVWLGSGQSNMELSVQESQGGAKTISEAKDTQIRLFFQNREMALTPSGETTGRWMVCSPENAKDFSAVAYYFGKELRKGLKVPVGLIEASWGGSFIESWIPETKLKQMPEARGLLGAWNRLSVARRKVWSKGVNPDLRLSEIRFIPKDPRQAPLTVLLKPSGKTDNPALGGNWSGDCAKGSKVEYQPLDEKGPQNGPVGLFKGYVQGGAWGFVDTPFRKNEQPVDLSGYQSLEFSAKGSGEYFIFLPQPSIKDGCNWSSFSFKLSKAWKSYRIDFDRLKQDSWGKPTPFTPEAIQRLAFGVVSPTLTNVPGVIYNGMIAPVAGYRIRGILWYQGEANEWDAKNYRKYLPAMIASWRKAWGMDELPFLICQLPDFRSREKDPVDGNWPLIREGQDAATKIPNVEMSVLLGLGAANDIHPKNKTDVGRRLSRVASHLVYGKEVEWTGPRFESMTVEGARLRIHFKYADKGLKVEGGTLKGFAIAGIDGKFRWAKAKLDGSSVLVWNDQIPEPVAVRYAWADNPDANLMGKNGLPTAPFRTDVSFK